MDALQIMGFVVGAVSLFAAVYHIYDMSNKVDELELEVKKLQQRVKLLRSK